MPTQGRGPRSRWPAGAPTCWFAWAVATLSLGGIAAPALAAPPAEAPACHFDAECPPTSRCLRGRCAAGPGGRPPGPPAAPPPHAPLAGRTLVDPALAVGPSFPVGLLADLELLVGGTRVGVGVGSTWDAGGVGARLSLFRPRWREGPWRLGPWAALAGLWTTRPATAGAWGPVLGSGRRLFGEGRVDALWLGGGLGLHWHGAGEGRAFLRLEAALALLVRGRYPPGGELAVTPMLGARWGWTL